MKKIIISIFTVLSLFMILQVKALESNTTANVVEIFEDGSYIEVTIEKNNATRSSTVTGNKTYSYKDETGKLLWSVKITGTFTYDGSNAKCTNSSIRTSCPAFAWKLSNISSSKSNATAYGYVTAKRYNAVGVCLQTINKTVNLTCSPSGKLP